MKSVNYSRLLLTLTFALCFISAGAQVKKQPAKKPAAPTAKKPAAKKPAARTTRPANKPAAAKLGDAATRVPADTTKRGGQSAAGNNGTNPGLSEEIVVTTTYKPVLADAVKIRRNPNLEDVTPYRAPLTYNSLLDKKLTKDNEIRPLQAMPMPAEHDTLRYDNYVKAGLGSLKTTYAEAYVNNGQDQAMQIGAYAKHFAQQGTLTKQNEMRDDLSIFGKNAGDNNTISGRINYNYRSNYFYGYDQVTPPATAFTPGKQHFNTIGAEGELAKNYKDTDRAFTYALKLKGYAFSDAYKARENNIVVSGFLNQTIKQFYAGLGASLDVASQTDSAYSQNNSLLRLNPYLKFQGTNYKIDAGVNIVDQFGYASKFYIFPAAKLEFQVIPNYVRLFAEAKGDVNRTSLYELSLVNPFLGQNLNIQNSVDQLDLAVGLKGTILPGLSFKASFFRNSVKNLPLLVSNFNTTGVNNKFTVIYDNGRARISGFNGELDYKASDGFDLFGRVEFKDYSLASQAQPWNLPKFKLTAGTVIHISNKVDINGSLLIRGSALDPHPADNSVGSTITYSTIKSYADLSAGVQYKVNKRFNLFAQANNILNAKEQTWLYYPNYGFNIFGGVGFSF